MLSVDFVVVNTTYIKNVSDWKVYIGARCLLTIRDDITFFIWVGGGDNVRWFTLYKYIYINEQVFNGVKLLKYNRKLVRMLCTYYSGIFDWIFILYNVIVA